MDDDNLLGWLVDLNLYAVREWERDVSKLPRNYNHSVLASDYLRWWLVKDDYLVPSDFWKLPLNLLMARTADRVLLRWRRGRVRLVSVSAFLWFAVLRVYAVLARAASFGHVVFYLVRLFL